MVLSFVLVWLFLLALCYIRGGKDYFKLFEFQCSLIHIIGGLLLASIGLCFKDENILKESVVLDFSLGYFVADLIVCLEKRDYVFIVHALVSMGLNYVCRQPAYYALRCGSQGFMTELSTIPYLFWQKTKKKSIYQVFVGVFFLCRIVWTPLFLRNTFSVVGIDTMPLLFSLGFYILQLGFFSKMISILKNYKEEDKPKLG